MAGLVCHFNIFYVKQWLRVPRAITSICSRLFGNLFFSVSPDNNGNPQGATLEIQRQIRMDELDQQMWNLPQTNVTRRWPVSIYYTMSDKGMFFINTLSTFAPLFYIYSIE